MLRTVLRLRYLILTLSAFGFMLNHLRGTGIDWRYFVEGSELIVGQHRASTPYPGGLHLYANYPDFQIGPLSLLIAVPVRILGGDYSRELGAVVMTAVAPVLIYVLERTSRYLRPPQDDRDEMFRSLTALLGGLMVVAAWHPLSTIYAHLDDVVALTAIVAALWSTAHRRPVVQGLAIAAAVAAKPWGVLLLPMPLAFRREQRVKAFLVAAAGILAAWAPFVIADTATLEAAEPQNRVVDGSVLHLLGVPVMDAPTWVRAVQLAATLIVGTVAVWRGRWIALPLVGIATRVALDSQIFLYYGTGLVLGALSWDLLRARRVLPITTLVTFVFLNDAYIAVGNSTMRATMRLVATLGVVGFVLFNQWSPPPRRAVSSSDETQTAAESRS